MARARPHTNEGKTREIAHVAAYVRVSTDEQADSGLGLADQRRRTLGMAQGKGWPDPTVYADEGLSGTKEPKDRPALAHLLADVRASKIDAVIVLSLDRLGRQTRMVLDLVEELGRHGVQFLSCKEQLDTSTPQGQFVLTMFAALAQLERDVIAQRTRDALAELGRTTGDRGGRIPYGYVRSSTSAGAGMARVHPDAAAIVRRIFALHRRGESLRTIAGRLNDSGVPAPRGGNTWRHTSIAEILANRAAYLGGQRGASARRWPAILGKNAA